MKRLILTLVFGLALRLVLIPVAHHGDLNNNISWGQLLVERGPANFYGSSDANDWPYSAPNQPPLTLLTFGATSLVYGWVASTSNWLNSSIAFFPSGFIWYWQTDGMDLLVKLPGILADVVIGYAIYQFVLRKTRKQKLALGLTAVWLANPLTWYNSAIWGQTDSIVNLLGLFAVFALLDRKLVKFAVLFALSLLFKGSLAIWVPVLLLIVFRQKYSLHQLAKAAFAALGCVLVVGIWFHPQLDFPVWLVQLYSTRILPGEIGYLTANAFNYWWLLDPGKVLDSQQLLGLTARVWGLMLVGLLYVMVLANQMRAKIGPQRLFRALVLTALITFLFMTRIHERYLYPFFPFATLMLAYDTWLWLPYIILSLVHLLNLYHLFWAPGIPQLEILYSNQFFAQALSALTILYGGYIFWRVVLTNQRAQK